MNRCWYSYFSIDEEVFLAEMEFFLRAQASRPEGEHHLRNENFATALT